MKLRAYFEVGHCTQRSRLLPDYLDNGTKQRPGSISGYNRIILEYAQLAEFALPPGYPYSSYCHRTKPNSCMLELKV